VTVDGASISKAGTPTALDADIALSTPDHPYVGRGGIKLAHALDVFGIGVPGRVALDIGASTGGFTDVMLQRGAQHVVALDVGHAQLAWKLRQDPRVTVLEGINARSLEGDMLPARTRRFDLITVDVSFISLKLIVGRIPRLLREDGNVVVLVKPQFEAERAEVGKKGVVRDPAVRQRVVDDVAAVANALGLKLAGTTPSPITGAEGNQEVFLHLVSRA
jgi:23S rRNA (cytidine1920-2'-O)/16S rRNA (cytidine1409-2'-O)-methyltransferase